MAVLRISSRSVDSQAFGEAFARFDLDVLFPEWGDSQRVLTLLLTSGVLFRTFKTWWFFWGHFWWLSTCCGLGLDRQLRK